MIPLETLETERLLLKKITPEIFSDLFENYSQAEIKSLLGLTTDAEFEKEKMKSDGGYKSYDRTIVSFLLVLKSNNQTVGRSGFHNWYQTHHRAEIGYALSNDNYKRNGYMTEALAAIIDYGFDKMDLNRIEAYIGKDNIASLTLIKKFNFVLEGRLRQHYNNDGEITDSLLFSLLKPDYQTE